MIKTQPTSDVRDRILETARKLFINNGFDTTSVRDIAAASDTNVAMVNYYFRTKYNLFEIIFDEAFTILMNKVFIIFNEDKPFFELIDQWISTYYDVLIEYPQIPIFILNEINQNPQQLTERIRNHKPYEFYQIMSAKIENEIKKGTIRQTSAIDLMLNVLSMCLFPFMFGKLAVRVAGKTLDEYNDILKEHKKYVVEFVINALKPCE